jgi:hypothetical protein
LKSFSYVVIALMAIGIAYAAFICVKYLLAGLKKRVILGMSAECPQVLACRLRAQSIRTVDCRRRNRAGRARWRRSGA